MTENRKTWVCAVVLMLFATIVVGNDNEEVVEMALKDKDGDDVQQTVSVNSKEKVAAFYVNCKGNSHNILYDYAHNIIGFREKNGQRCLVVNMKGMANAPSLDDILNTIKDYQNKNSISEREISYNLVDVEQADRIKLGVPINIMCSDVPIYWATQRKTRWGWLIKPVFVHFVKKGIDKLMG